MLFAFEVGTYLIRLNTVAKACEDRCIAAVFFRKRGRK